MNNPHVIKNSINFFLFLIQIFYENYPKNFSEFQFDSETLLCSIKSRNFHEFKISENRKTTEQKKQRRISIQQHKNYMYKNI